MDLAKGDLADVVELALGELARPLVHFGQHRCQLRLPARRREQVERAARPVHRAPPDPTPGLVLGRVLQFQEVLHHAHDLCLGVEPLAPLHELQLFGDPLDIEVRRQVLLVPVQRLDLPLAPDVEIIEIEPFPVLHGAHSGSAFCLLVLGTGQKSPST